MNTSNMLGRTVVFAGLLAAVALGICGLRSHWTTVKLAGKTSSITELDRHAQPFFEEAQQNVPHVVAKLTDPPTIQHIYTYQIKKSVQPTGYDAFFLLFLFAIICSPTLRAYVKSGCLTQIKLSQRKIRFDESEILHFANTGMSTL